MGTLLTAIFLASVALALFIQRRPLAHMQAMVLGGSVVPGCVVAEAVVLLAIAIAFAVVHFTGLLS
jgi:hypothetical protein